MTRIARATIYAWAVVESLIPAACLADAPSVDEVLKICRANREKLNPLHVQATHIEERTEAFGKSQQKNAIAMEAILKQLETDEGAAALEKQMPGISSPQYRESLRQGVKGARALATTSARFEHKYEFFVNGENFQVRSALEPIEENWKFSDAPLSADTLTKDYAHTHIYSRSVGRTPPAQIWPGQPSPNSEAYAMITAKPIAETQNMQFPAFMQAMRPPSLYIHPIDTFFSAPADRYRVVGQEQKDGRLLTIVEVLVPTDQKGGRTGPDGKPEQFDIAYPFRAWLDLDRGGIPIALKSWYGSEGEPFDEHFRETPYRVITTSEVKKLAGGAYYPTCTVEEEYNADPDTPTLTEAQWAEVRAGTRKPPPNVVFSRNTWNCTAVDTDARGADFYVLKFPEGQKFFDFDAGKVVGALENTPAIKAGELAPSWKLARWLDGKAHTLDEFRGKVVVLDFWGLWCSACRNAVPALAALQEKFKDKPVVFVSIHTAENDPQKLIPRIEKFKSEQGWHSLAAIDAGTMIEDSTTSHAYGCTGFPTLVIISPDGRVTFDSSVPEPGMEGIVGKTCDQITPEDQVKIDAYEKAQFEAAGEKWPLPKDIGQQELKEIANRMLVFQMSQRITDALKAVDPPQK